MNTCLKRLIVLFLLVSAFAGCSKYELIDNSANKDELVVFEATIENCVVDKKTKTYIDENKKILWHKKDELTIFGSTLNEKFQFDGETGDNSGTFTKVDTGNYGSGNTINRNYAIYPYDKNNKIENDESFLTVSFPKIQYYSENSIGRGTNVAVAVTDDLNDKFLSFKNACSYLCFSMYAGISEDYIRTIEIEGRNGEKIAGTGKVTITDDKIPIATIIDDANASESIIIDCANGVKIGNNKDDSGITKFWITLPPITFLNGMRFIITNINGDQTVREITANNIVFERSKINTLRIKFDQANAVNINKQKERNALVALYNSLGGDGWTNKTNWMDENVEVSEWYGVTVDSEGFVTGIDLSNNNLSGTIPDEIGDFSKLVTLCFGDYLNNQNNNNITGTLPESICKLTSLEYLDLSSNQLEGALPENIGNLSKMNQLFLNNNQFTGSIPESIWTGMKQLGLLWLSRNKFTGGLTSSIGNATSLSELRATYNSFSSPLPAEICNLTNLGVLELSYSGITGAIPDNIGNMKNLQFMWLRGNNLSGSIPGSIGEMTNLIDLDLRQNSLRGSVPDAIGELKNLNKLLLSDNMFSGSIPSTIGGCTNLTDLDISLNRIEGEIPESLGTCTKLVNLYLSFNRLGGEVIDFEPLVNLKKLYLDYNTELGGTISGKVLNNLSGYSIDGTKIGIEKDTGLQDPVQGGENMPWE